MSLKGLATIGKKTSTMFSRGGLKLQKHSPELLLAAGITGFVVTVVVAARATLKCEALIQEHDAKMDMITKSSLEFSLEQYTEEARKKDIVIVKVSTATKFVRLYTPTITLGVASIACVLSAYTIMSKRNVALIAAYKLVEFSFSEYRDRVRAELGPDKDFHFRYGTIETEVVETTVDEDGKKTKIKKTLQTLDQAKSLSMYARSFEAAEYFDGTWTGSTQFSRVHHYNKAYILSKQNWVNDRLNAQKFLFLNDVYEELGFPRTKAGQVVGWSRDSEDGDGYISFGETLDFFSYDDGDPILLDFNVDGVIWDLI